MVRRLRNPALSALYVFTLRLGRRVTAGQLPPYPDRRKRDDLFLVIGEVHEPRRPGPSRTPSWLIVPERGLFMGIAVFGAVGSGKKYILVEELGPHFLTLREKDSTLGLSLRFLARSVARQSSNPGINEQRFGIQTL